VTDQSITALESGRTAPKLTEEQLVAKIAKVDYALVGLLSVCVITLENGFMVSGESAAVSPENHHVKIGNHYAYKKAFAKVWELEGYLLKERLHREAQQRERAASPQADPAALAAEARSSSLHLHQTRDS